MSKQETETATLAGGCFWCLEAVFERLEGVVEVVSGYIGGHLPDPDYEAVCSGETGHAEAVQISYAAGTLSFEELLTVFFSIHDPTLLNRQGNDIGTQYRSAIFYHSEQQRQTAQNMINELNARLVPDTHIVTELRPAPVFYPAEPYHQHYFSTHPGQGYCQFVIQPKLEKLQRNFHGRLKRD